jgi:hypothetical protein
LRGGSQGSRLIAAIVAADSAQDLGIVLDGRPLYAGDAPAHQGGPQPETYDGDFARADGFDSLSDMVDFFEKQYGLPFHGQLIEWKL